MAFSLSPPVDPLIDDTQWGVGWKPRSHLSYFPIKCHCPARPLQICSALHFIAPTQHMWSRLWKWTGCLSTVIIADAHVSKNLIGLSKKVGAAVEKLKLKQVSNGSGNVVKALQWNIHLACCCSFNRFNSSFKWSLTTLCAPHHLSNETAWTCLRWQAILKLKRNFEQRQWWHERPP